MRARLYLAGCLIAVSLLQISCSAKEATYQGRRTSEWARDLKDADVETRVAAVEALGAIGADAAEVTSQVLDFLLDESADDSLRIAAWEALPNFGESAVPHLIEVLDGSSQQQVLICDILAKIGPQAVQAVPRLLEVATEGDIKSRVAAIEALGEIRTDAAEVLSIAMDILRDKSADVSLIGAAAVAVPKFGENAVPHLIAMLDGSFLNQVDACYLLAEIGPQAVQAVPRLLEVASGGDSRGRSVAIRALTEIGQNPGERYVSVLVQAISDSTSADLREQACIAAGTLGLEAKPVVPSLIEVIKSDQQRVRWAAMEAVGKIGPDAAAAIPVIIAGLGNSFGYHPTSRRISCEVLPNLGPQAVQAIPVIEELLQERQGSKGKQQLTTALSALRQIEKLGPSN